MDSVIIGNRIKALLIIKHMKRKELAQQLNISYNSLTKKLNGNRGFTIDEIIQMKDIFKLDIQFYANSLFCEGFEILH